MSKLVHWESIVLTSLLLSGITSLFGPTSEELESVLLHPVMTSLYMCAEHGGAMTPGDSYGKDCVVVGLDTDREAGRLMFGLYENGGLINEEWYGWQESLLAPCDGIVASTSTNPATNEPGILPTREELEPASKIVFECPDEVNVVYAHVRNVSVEAGETVKAGIAVAEIGNNGYSTSPHVHIGAWRDETPLQIRFDLRLMNK